MPRYLVRPAQTCGKRGLGTHNYCDTHEGGQYVGLGISWFLCPHEQYLLDN